MSDMPETIWASAKTEDCFAATLKPFKDGTKYTRADITEQLAAALEKIMENTVDNISEATAHQALEKFRGKA